MKVKVKIDRQTAIEQCSTVEGEHELEVTEEFLRSLLPIERKAFALRTAAWSLHRAELSLDALRECIQQWCIRCVGEYDYPILPEDGEFYRNALAEKWGNGPAMPERLARLLALGVDPSHPAVVKLREKLEAQDRDAREKAIRVACKYVDEGFCFFTPSRVLCELREAAPDEVELIAATEAAVKASEAREAQRKAERKRKAEGWETFLGAVLRAEVLADYLDITVADLEELHERDEAGYLSHQDGELVDLARDSIFVFFEAEYATKDLAAPLVKYKRLNPNQVEHKNDCYEGTVSFDKAEPEELSRTEFAMLREAERAAKVLAEHLSTVDAPIEVDVAPREHIAQCDVCERAVKARSLLVTVSIGERDLSRAYTLV